MLVEVDGVYIDSTGVYQDYNDTLLSQFPVTKNSMSPELLKYFTSTKNEYVWNTKFNRKKYKSDLNKAIAKLKTNIKKYEKC